MVKQKPADYYHKAAAMAMAAAKPLASRLGGGAALGVVGSPAALAAASTGRWAAAGLVAKPLLNVCAGAGKGPSSGVRPSHGGLAKNGYIHLRRPWMIMQGELL